MSNYLLLHQYMRIAVSRGSLVTSLHLTPLLLLLLLLFLKLSSLIFWLFCSHLFIVPSDKMQNHRDRERIKGCPIRENREHLPKNWQHQDVLENDDTVWHLVILFHFFKKAISFTKKSFCIITELCHFSSFMLTNNADTLQI